ncbi:hypothetical protein [Curtobacterium sp. RRHDQ10]|uniref:hypothetical protein n=1 Tax=Curtobacterium phyllosphaerae TaxID=3413379 RepID=UPI003BF1BA2B
MTMSKDEFRAQFRSTGGRLGLGYPHVGEEQAAMVVHDDVMLQATYEGWLRAQSDQAARGGPAGRDAGADPGPAGPGASAPVGPSRDADGDRGYGASIEDQPPYGQVAPGSGTVPGGPPYGRVDPGYGPTGPGYGPTGPGYGAPTGSGCGPSGRSSPSGAPYGGGPGDALYRGAPGGPYQGRRVVASPVRPFVVAIIGIAVGWVFWGLGVGLGIWALQDVLVLRRVIPKGAKGSTMLSAAFALAIVSIVFGAFVILRRLLGLSFR